MRAPVNLQKRRALGFFRELEGLSMSEHRPRAAMSLGGVRKIYHRTAACAVLTDDQDLHEISNIFEKNDDVSLSAHVTLHHG